jgi:phosphate transport system substrate-binding protein
VKSTSMPRALVLGAMSLTVALGLSACGASNESSSSGSSGNGASTGSGASSSMSGDLNGAGSSAQEAAMAAWKAGFQTANPDVTVNYDAVGSSGGREQFIAGGVEFAGSDSYFTTDELKAATKTCGGPAIEVPVYVSPIAIVYNLSGVDKLQLSPKTLTKIFAGKITTWNDPAIVADNPGAKLPSTAISPVHRSDGSGTTANFTEYLDAVDKADYTAGPTDTWPIKSGEGADGTSGVISAVSSGEGTIGYADASQAGKLGKASIKVGGAYVQPSTSAASKILDESKAVPGRSAANDLAIAVNRTSTTAGVYPIILVSYQMSCSTYDSQATADLVKAFEQYVVSPAGQAAAAKQAGSAPITAALRAKALKAIGTIGTNK